jgi:hypothetical protein
MLQNVLVIAQVFRRVNLISQRLRQCQTVLRFNQLNATNVEMHMPISRLLEVLWLLADPSVGFFAEAGRGMELCRTSARDERILQRLAGHEFGRRGYNRLHHAVAAGNLIRVQMWLHALSLAGKIKSLSNIIQPSQHGAVSSEQLKSRPTPLALACFFGHREIADTLTDSCVKTTLDSLTSSIWDTRD